MSIKEKKYCGTHSKEKEEKGVCCRTEEKDRAEALTYEQSFVTIERQTADNNTKGTK